MAPPVISAAVVLSLLATRIVAQSQTIISGNGNLPACAQTCTELIQATQACSGLAPQNAWICFCQSAYLAPLRQSAATTCSETCSNPADLQQVLTWFQTNCGSDDGASEHTGVGAVTTTTAGGGAAATSASAGGVASPSAGTAAGSSGTPGASGAPSGDWWSTHYKWIVMLIVLAVGLTAIGLLGLWLKRRHERRQDQIRNGFNAGITSRSGPVSRPDQNHSGVLEPPSAVEESGRNSPARTRDAFMPYGYGYSRSESRLASRQAGPDDRRSPLAVDRVPDTEEKAGAVGGPAPSQKKSRRTLVRERSTADSAEGEKSSRLD